MEEKEINLSDMLFYAFRKWRVIVIFSIICAIAIGAFAAVGRAIDMNDPEKVALWKTEYEVAHGSYWAGINDLDRQISENDRLASQAQIEIEKLSIKKSDYEGKLVDLDASITYYEARIKDSEAKIEQLKKEREKLEYYLKYRNEQNEKSLLMAIDPYNVNVYEAYIRVDSGYEIIPDSTYQNPDPTEELLQTYRLLVSSTSFYNKMISELKLNTEVRYLTEVISVNEYNTNSLRIRIISDSANWAKNVGSYISKAILAEHEHVSMSIAEHELEEYNNNSYSVVDLDTYSKQYAFIQEAIEYEADIRAVDMTILSTESSIRDLNTDIRTARQTIDDVNLAITELPLEKQSLENEINGYKDANFELRTEQLGLLANPEPEYKGYTTTSIFTGFVKFAVIGGIVGVVLAVVYFAVIGLMSKKVFSAAQVCDAVKSEFFGFWPKTNKRKFAFVDSWISRMAGTSSKDMTPDVAKEIVVSNVAVACAEKTKIMLCGGADKEAIAEVVEAIKGQLQGVEVLFGGTIEADPSVVRGVAECDAVIIMEQIDKSGLNAALALKERAQAMEKSVLGVIAVN